MKIKSLILMFAMLTVLTIGSVSAVWFNDSTPFTDDTTAGANAGKYGYQFVVYNGSINLRVIIKYALDNSIMGYLLDADKNVLVNASFIGNSALMNYTLINGTTYYFAGDGAGASVAHRYKTAATYPQTTYFKYVGGLSNGVNDSSEGNAIGNATFESLAGGSDVYLNSPTNNSASFTGTIQFNSSARSTNQNYINVTIYLYNSANTLVNSTTNLITGNTTNSTTWNISITSIGTYKWNALWCGSDIITGSACSFALSNNTLIVGTITNSTTYNTTTLQTSSETFITNITVSSGLSLSSATLYYNGTGYAGTVTSLYGNSYSLSRTIDIPSTSSGSVPWFWALLFSSGAQQNLTVQSQTCNTISFGFCNASLTVRYANFSFKNETTPQEKVNSSFTSTWFYWLGSGSQNKTLSFTNSSYNAEYNFCFSPNSSGVYASPSVAYLNSESPQRNYNPGTLLLTNITYNKTLFLLPTSLGQTVAFQIISPSEQAISGATVNVSSSTFGDVEIKTTDGSGIASFFLNPLSTYTVIVSAEGYSSVTTTITPSLTSYTIQLGGSASTGSTNDFFRGIYYGFIPTANVLTNDTTHSFNFTLVSSYWTVTSFGYNLSNSSGSIFTSNSALANGGNLSSSLNVGKNQSILMNAYWIIDGNTTYVSRTWTIQDDSYTGTSIFNFANRLNSYLTSGSFFGLTSFGINIIVFLIIFIFTGVFSYKFGFTSPAAVTGIMFVATFIFDVVLGLITYAPMITVPNLASIIMFLVLLSFTIKEVYT